MSEGFGRFGHTRIIQVAGFEIDQTGFRSLSPGSDRLWFKSEIKEWKSAATSPWRQIILTEGQPQNPSKLRFDLMDFGFGLLFNSGIELKVKSFSAPLLTFESGSVDSGVPTPNVDWIAVSFRDRQPPIVFGFPDSKGSLIVEGSAGSWTIKSASTFKGWMRVSLPYGKEGMQSSSTSALGKLAKRCKDFETLWYGPLVDCADPIAEDDPAGITLTWTLPRKRCVIPNAFFLSQYGGYSARILSPYTVYDEINHDGPILLTQSNTLTVRLPVKRVPTGRGISQGEPFPALPSQLSWDDPRAIVELALKNTQSGRSTTTFEQAKAMLASYYESAKPSQEPLSKLRGFYDGSGAGIFAAAAHGFLNQTVKSSEETAIGEDPQLISLAWRIDPGIGSAAASQSEEVRRAYAVGAIAGAFSASPRMRVYAGLMQAALSGQRGLAVWRKRRAEIREDAQFIEPLLAIRRGLFSLINPGDLDPILGSWQSELRCYGGMPMWIQPKDGKFELFFVAPSASVSKLSLETGYDIEIGAGENTEIIRVNPLVGHYQVEYRAKTVGLSSILIQPPVWVGGLPLTVLPPKYSEVKL